MDKINYDEQNKYVVNFDKLRSNHIKIIPTTERT